MSHIIHIRNLEDYPIEPKEIDPDPIRLAPIFWNHEPTAETAGLLIRFAQKRGHGWRFAPWIEVASYSIQERMERKEVTDAQEELRPLSLHALITPTLIPAPNGYRNHQIRIGGYWIVVDDHHQIRFTRAFVNECYRRSPAH